MGPTALARARSRLRRASASVRRVSASVSFKLRDLGGGLQAAASSARDESPGVTLVQLGEGRRSDAEAGDDQYDSSLMTSHV